jgi:hypothetical protein
MAGVSVVTLCKALAALKKQGFLAGRRGQATCVSGPDPGQSSRMKAAPAARIAEPFLREESHRRIFRRMRQEILDGFYEPGALLPLVKQLRNRHQAAAITIRRALSLLCDEGLVIPQRRHYAVARLSTADSGLRIGVLIQQISVDAYDLTAGEGHNYLRELELQAAKIPVGITVAPFDWHNDQWAIKKPCSMMPPADCSRIAGYMLAVSTPSEDFRNICAELALMRKPVSVLDFDGGWIPQKPGRQPYAVFPVGVSSLHGKKAATYLLSLGHRHIAYFSMFHKSRWSVTRYNSMQNACAEAGFPECMQLLSRPEIDGQASDDKAAIPDLSGWSKLQTALDTLALRKRMNAALQLLFAQAISDPAITAWVAANDYIAVCAQEFLQAKGIDIPGRISLMSFDDSVLAMTHRITSFNFNLPGIVNAAFRHILQSKRESRSFRPRTIEIPGAIVERETTGAAFGGPPNEKQP